MEDSRRRSLPRNSEREAGHDRVVFVRPLVELDDLVPVLGLVQRLTLIEPRCRHEHPVLALIGPFHAILRLERSAPPEHIAAGTLKTAAGPLPGACQVRLPVGQPRRRSLRRVLLRRRRTLSLDRHANHDETERIITTDAFIGTLTFYLPSAHSLEPVRRRRPGRSRSPSSSHRERLCRSDARRWCRRTEPRF